MMRGSAEGVGGCSTSTPRCEFWNWGEDYLRPSCCSGHLVGVAVFVHHALEEAGISHWLDFGSLLGAVRDGQLIPWDSDVDFGYLEEDHDAVVDTLCRAAAWTTYEVDLGEAHVIRVNISKVNLQHADLFAWQTRGEMLAIRYAGKPWPGVAEPWAFPRRFVDRLEPVVLEGHTFPAPSPVGALLAHHRFGPDYLIPTRGLVNISITASTSPESFVPSVRRIWEELGRKERQVLRLHSNITGALRSRWAQAGRPRTAPRAMIARHLRDVADEHRGALARELAGALATVELELDELARPSPATRLRRNMRRTSRLAARALRHRPRVTPL
jgi:hypothetical protein